MKSFSGTGSSLVDVARNAKCRLKMCSQWVKRRKIC